MLCLQAVILSEQMFASFFVFSQTVSILLPMLLLFMRVTSLPLKCPANMDGC